MNATVIPLRRNAIAEISVIVAGAVAPSPLLDAPPMTITIPSSLADSIRLTAGMHSKNIEDFVIDWLKSGFPEKAA